jgi:hypothetical protein
MYQITQVDEEIMVKNENIHIRLEISKDPTSGEINLLTRFDPDAPNFTKDETGFKWYPTSEERAFLNEAFDMILKRK